MLRILLLSALLARIGAEKSDHELLQENEEREEVMVTASGLQYEVLHRGPSSGKVPDVHDKCLVHYRGTLLKSGQEFDHSGTDRPAKFQPSSVVPGFKEALLLMRSGDKFKFWVPSALGYGKKTTEKVPRNSALVYEIEMVEVDPEPHMIEWSQDLLAKYPFIYLLVGMVLFQVGFFGIMCYCSGSESNGGASFELRLPMAEKQPENVSVWFEVQIGDEKPGLIQMELFTKKLPLTTENFRSLCVGDKGPLGKPLSFRGSPWHRIIPGFMCQGGDITAGDGTGGNSIYGANFADEWQSGYISHSKAGLLSMANSGKDTNSSQFFITLAKCTHLDKKHVVFGQVTSGMDVVRKMAAVGTSTGATCKKVVTVDCGEAKSKST